MALPPLVFIPGLQGRWEYMRRAVDALAPVCHVVTFSLDDVDAGDAGRTFDPERGMDSYVDQIDAGCSTTLQIDPRAAICGVSFGGLIALQFAARRPHRTSALILVSTPGPRWTLTPSRRLFTRFPWLAAPVFFVGMPRRLRAELVRAIPDARERATLRWEQARTLVARAAVADADGCARAPHRHRGCRVRRLRPRRRRPRSSSRASRRSIASCLLRRHVRVRHRMIPGARLLQLDHTGHLGCITRPREFAAGVSTFLAALGDRHAA